MVLTTRQEIIETNRSLRNIKNELENLLEKGVLTDEAFEAVHALLPAESPLSAAGASSARATPALPTRSTAAPPTSAMSNLDLASNAHQQAPPPAYEQTGPPPLPGRVQPPAPPPSKPVIAHARALYKYAASDARDLSLDKDDKVAVHEKMNDDWWMGRNLRTGEEGIFPKTYVVVESEGEKAAAVGYAGAVGGPPPQKNPYNSDAPPMAIANDGGSSGGSGGKVGEHGKKFGKKLGNAAIFGAGATIGSNIVNSIF